jgi:adenylylsulfate kinase
VASKPSFAVWLTGLPASGKSTIAAALQAQLSSLGVTAAVLESDVLRPVFTPNPRYDDQERETFYKQMACVGTVLTRQGIPVIFDATANRRSHRNEARRQIPQFLEVFVDCPLETCLSRDPKGIYRNAREGRTASMPGLQSPYEPPEAPDVVVHTTQEAPESAARRVIAKLTGLGYLAAP